MKPLKANSKPVLKNLSNTWFSAIFLLFLACGQDSANTAAVAYADSDMGYELEETVMEASRMSSKQVKKPQQQQEQKIIKTGVLEFETQNLEETYASIQKVLKTYNGYIQNDNSGKNHNKHYRYLTVRVPSTHFQPIVDEVSNTVAFFDTKSISRRDVTEEFIDLTARLKAKRELESRYIELLQRANTVKEVLDIERELSKLREDIESKQGRLEYLQSQVSYSTINIDFYKSISESNVTISYGKRMTNALKTGWFAISSVFLGILTLWPLLIVGIVALVLIRRWLKKK